MQTLKGRTCVMAGATAGDGRAVVKELCLGGMNVALMTHNREAALSLIEEVKASGAEGMCFLPENIPGDGPDEEKTQAYRLIEEQFGSVDVIISNTGGANKDIPLEETDPAYLLENIEHLALGSFKMLKAALPFLKKSKAPRVIFMTTVEGENGGCREGFATAVAKGAVGSLTKNAAAHLAGTGVTVNAIAKGAIPRIEGIHPGDIEPTTLLDTIPMGRLGSPEDLAHVVSFLASEESAYMTGQILFLSGGWH